ncbi:hypothetical protein EDB92DRAFT_1814275 [Lactarius akahatsu]|uniref:Uncharacterized protein n=1 Tax=Lactarius akahatsu TaxID=416441 RepID=A0AAD4QFX7_9AGAM|nr:hypothetical protein EDB92DRAFT_1814275 [Lactarius akahatsu]
MDGHRFVKNPHLIFLRPSTRSNISSSILLTYPTPALRVGTRRTPTSHVPPNPSPDPVSNQIQITSLRGALEAARLREEKSRMEAECRAKEYDALADAISRRLRIDITPHNPVLDDTRGQRRKREVQDNEVVRNPVMNVLPLCDEVVSAILKRPESLVTDVQPRSPRFSSLPDMGRMWYVERTETEELNKEKCAAAEDGGDMKQ